MNVGVVNAGSSSLKYRVLALPEGGAEGAPGEILAEGLIDRIGVAGSGDSAPEVPDHDAALARMLADVAGIAIDAVGHRVVHGGERFDAPTLVDDGVEAAIEELAELAPLHNPPALAGIRAARRALPGVPQVAVFDTAFHRTLPPEAATYALDLDLARAHGVRRYGFHGTSYRYVAGATARFLGRPLADLRLVVLHLGNGASACAIAGGRSIDTSMGLTPLAGLVMGTRSGDVDPGALLHLARVAGLGADELDALLNRRSGLLGLSGHADMREVVAAAEAGDERAELALGVMAHRARHYVGGYAAALGGLDALVFTAGIGENSPEVRTRIVGGLAALGLELDPGRNRGPERGPRDLSAEGARARTLVIPTDEELEIARQTLEVVGG
ncbi:MAG: acetate kinase [Actinomycetales bacterium]|nr:acetate kinase [Actinomycetales bacterium]